MAGIGPAPFCGMMLADHGADVIRVERVGGDAIGLALDPEKDILNRGKRVVRADLKTPEGQDQVRDLARTADGLIEGFRPGVMERLQLGPELLLEANPRLVYGRMTGWGQTGPLAQTPGHDIDYIALAGNLHGYGRADGKPTPPANAVGDFGGGGMLLAFGMVAALLHAGRTGEGQVVDCAMVDGTALLAAQTWSLRAMGLWEDRRGANLLDGGAPFYDTYECADGRWVAVGAIEPQFFAALLELTGVKDPPSGQFDKAGWPALAAQLTAAFRLHARDYWTAHPQAAAACVAPVLSMAEAPHHPHNAARGTFAVRNGVTQPMPAPRFLRTPSA